MSIIQLILLFVMCTIGSFVTYGLWLLENSRDEFRRKHGIDPKYNGWKVDENDKHQDQ